MQLHQFQSNFNAYSRREGQNYFRHAASKLVKSKEDLFHFEVEGSCPEPYDVFLDFRNIVADDGVVAYCSCPRYEDGDFCKHIWSCLLNIQGELRRKSGSDGPVDLISTDVEQAWQLKEELYFQTSESAEVNRGRNAARQNMGEPTVGGGDAAVTVPSKLTPLTMMASPSWREDLRVIGHLQSQMIEIPREIDYQLWYAINVSRSMQENCIAVDVFERQNLGDGLLSKPKLIANRGQAIRSTSNRTELDFLDFGWQNDQDLFSSWRYSYNRRKDYQLSMSSHDAEVFFPRLAMTGRLMWLLRADQAWDHAQSLQWDATPYRFELTAARSEEAGHWTVGGQLTRVDDAITLSVSQVVLQMEGLVLFPERIGILQRETDSLWIAKLASRPWIIKDEERVDFLQYLSATVPTGMRFPDEFCRAESIAPKPVLAVEIPVSAKKQEVLGKLVYSYGEARVPAASESDMAFDRSNGVMYARDRKLEQVFVNQANGPLKLSPMGYWTGRNALRIPMADFPSISRSVSEAGWIVEANNERLRIGGRLSLNVKSEKTSGIDWFDLSGQIEFDGGWKASLPLLLEALRSGGKTIQLDDGSVGLLPEEWAKRFARLAELGHAQGGLLRFQSSQALLLDALLASDQSAQVDTGFQRIRERLQKTHQVKPQPSPRGFKGELRDYQKQGQGWISCLHDLQLGGCLADDMGLGKTIQVLSWLETLRQRAARKKSVERRPSLVVVPKSLVFNWVAEAAKFTPNLRVLNFTGKERVGLEDLKEIDLVVTTYGTMRIDIEKLREIDFEYLILDEAQAIKNSSAQAAKAARLLKGRHRLAMSGTPIENHIGELWSLFEFINPGLLGNSTAFQRVAKSSGSDPESLQWLSKAIAPFVLRRTKAQVLTELPDKSEQVIYCDMTPKHRKLYDDLRDHYRASLTQTVNERGLENSKIHVLEALLRLRQAACHPGLLNPKLTREPGPKLEELLERLREIIAEGHKALVFSQFTSFLGILQTHLLKQKLPYLYLDGKTSLKDRKSRVDKFQSDPQSSLFLISLKAGGSGLNLTAADYVFLLDPWWNPAVENQAIDRTHRIGQTRKVHACRLITRETVEEKVLELQATKKNLAEAILSIDGSLLRSLSWDDLQLLFE